MPAAHVLQLTPAAPGEQLDARLLRELTAAVRAEPEALRAAFTALQARLRAGDARVRIRAVTAAGVWGFGGVVPHQTASFWGSA